MKTPEDLAHEYADNNHDKISEQTEWMAAYNGFISGCYKDSSNVIDKMAINHNADASKMVWTSVKDRLPEINTGFIAFVENKEVCNCWRYNNDRKDGSPVFYAQTKSGLLICSLESLTHWQPLPQPPKKEE